MSDIMPAIPLRRGVPVTHREDGREGVDVVFSYPYSTHTHAVSFQLNGEPPFRITDLTVDIQDPLGFTYFIQYLLSEFGEECLNKVISKIDGHKASELIQSWLYGPSRYTGSSACRSLLQQVSRKLLGG